MQVPNDEGEGLESSLVIKRLQSLGFCTSPIEVPFTIQDGTEDEYLWRPYQVYPYYLNVGALCLAAYLYHHYGGDSITGLA